MADFDPIAAKTFVFEGGYQANPNDKANKNSKGELVGTNCGISAIAYEQYLGVPPTVADMQAITPDIAKDVYRQNFWDVMHGDDINSQGLAWMIFDFFIASGYYGLYLTKLFLNQTYQQNFDVATPWANHFAISQDVIDFLNNAPDQADILTKLTAFRKNYAKSIVNNDPSQRVFLTGWLTRIENISTVVLADIENFFTSAADTVKNNPTALFWIIGLGLSLLLLKEGNPSKKKDFSKLNDVKIEFINPETSCKMTAIYIPEETSITL